MPNERIAEPMKAAFDRTPRMRARAASVSMIAMTTAVMGGLAMPTTFARASHWWMTGVLTCDTLPSSSCRVCPWMNPGCHLKLASQAQSTPNRMRTTAAPRSQRLPKTAERVVLRDESAADWASSVVDTALNLSVDRGLVRSNTRWLASWFTVAVNNTREQGPVTSGNRFRDRRGD